MINIFSGKQKKHSDKYIELVRELRLKETNEIKENIIKLTDLKKDLNSYNFNDLKLMRIEVDTLVEDYRQTALLTNTITTILAVLTIFVNLLKDPILKAIGNSFLLFFILYVGIALILIIKTIGNFAGRSKDLSQLLNMIDLIIKEREEINQLHVEAYKDHLKFIKEDGSIT